MRNIRKVSGHAAFGIGMVLMLPRCAGDSNSSESHFLDCDVVRCAPGLICDRGYCVQPRGHERHDAGTHTDSGEQHTSDAGTGGAGGAGGDSRGSGGQTEGGDGAAGSGGAGTGGSANANGGTGGTLSLVDAGSGGASDAAVDPRCCNGVGGIGGAAGCPIVDGYQATCVRGLCTLNPASGDCAVDEDCVFPARCVGVLPCACGDADCSSVLGVCQVPASADSSVAVTGPCPNVGSVTEYFFPRVDGGRAYPRDLVVGPDGNIWVSVSLVSGSGGGAELVRVTPAGDMTAFPVPSAGNLAVGPDGNLWVTGSTSVSRVTTAGLLTEFPVPRVAQGYRGIGLVDITPGPDGALWFTEYDDNQIGRITTDGTLTEFTLPFPVQTVPEDPKVVGAYGIAVGPDGALWFTENETSAVGRITTAGVVTEYPLLSSVYSRHPVGIRTRGTGLVVVENYSAEALMSVSTAGVVTLLFTGSLPGANSILPTELSFTQDGSLWLGGDGNLIARVSPSGDVVTCDPSGGAATVNPFALVTADNGDVWFIEGGNDAVGFIRPKPL